MALDGNNPIAIRDWIADLTYEEIHSFIWAFGLTAGSTFVLPTDPILAQSGFALAFGILLWALTGRKVDNVKVPPYLIQQVKQESHYYIGGMCIGAIVGFLVRMV